MRSRLNSRIVFDIEIEIKFQVEFLILKLRLNSAIVFSTEIKVGFKNCF